MTDVVSATNLIDQAERLEALAAHLTGVARQSECADIRLAAQRLKAVAEGNLKFMSSGL